MGEGECCGSGWSVYVHLGMCTCPLRVSTARALWHSPLESEERLLSCRSPLVLQDGPAASPSALALGTGASFWMVLQGLSQGQRDTVWRQCPGGGLLLTAEIIYLCLFTDRYIFTSGDSAGMLWCDFLWWWPSICDILSRITRLINSLWFFSKLDDLRRPGEQNCNWMSE